MPDIRFAALSGNGYTTVDAGAVSRLEEAMAGRLLFPRDDEYEAARHIWNAMIDRRPALIARCKSSEDARHVVDFARDHQVLLSIRGGGHNIAGNAVCDDGVVLDLSEMRAVTVNAPERVARVQAGATLRDLDAATQAEGLATPVGLNSTTGVAGLTLGGGFGWLSRRLGMTIDNLVSAEVVCAGGEIVRASEQQHPDLFWALRGGGGNFGVVTQFELRLHPVGPEVLCGLVVYPSDQARTVLQRYRTAAEELGDATTAWVVLRKAPPLPFLPPDAHGSDVVVIALVHTGDLESGQQAFQPFGELGTPIASHIGLQPFTAWQQAFDPLLAPGARNYWKSHNFTRLEDGLFDVLTESARQVPSAECEVFIGQLGCATTRVAPDATAYPHRDARYVINMHGRWQQASQDEAGLAWARNLERAARPFASGGVYVNFMTDDENRVKAAYGSNYPRLMAIKHRYDRENLFRMNHNIPPEQQRPAEMHAPH